MTFSDTKNNTLSVKAMFRILEQLLCKLDIRNPGVLFYQLCLLL